MLIIPNFGTEHADVCKLGIGQCLFLNDNCQWQHRGAAFAGWDTPATGWQGGQFMTVCSAKDELSRFLGDTTWQRTGLEAYHPSKTTIDMTLPWCGGLEDYFSSTNMTVIINDYQWLSMIIRVTLFVGDCWGDAKYGEPPPNWDDRSWPWVPLAGGVQTLNKRSDMVCHRR